MNIFQMATSIIINMLLITVEPCFYLSAYRHSKASSESLRELDESGMLEDDETLREIQKALITVDIHHEDKQDSSATEDENSPQRYGVTFL